MSQSSVRTSDVLVVGGGILGLAHAIAAHRRGLSVRLVERHGRARGASVRNFGMIWPIGQPAGPMRDRALAAAEQWKEMSAEAGFWCDPCGSLHAAYADDEMDVLREFAADHADGLDVDLVDAAGARAIVPALVEGHLRGGLRSRSEVAINPREAIDALTHWLASRDRVDVEHDQPIREMQAIGNGDGSVEAIAADGTRYVAGRAYVCTGSDFESLYPEAFAATPVTRCKLQMMRTEPQPAGWRLGAHVAFGLTLAWYSSFDGCPSVGGLRERLERELPECRRHGVHVLVAQHAGGELVIGDSHAYGDDPDPFDRTDIDRVILDYLRARLDVPYPDPVERWHGVYLLRTDGEPVSRLDPEPRVSVVNAVGGAGMTLALSLGEESLARLF